MLCLHQFFQISDVFYRCDFEWVVVNILIAFYGESYEIWFSDFSEVENILLQELFQAYEL